MQIFWDINQLAFKKPSVLTLGTFDGIHIGHKRIVEHLVQLASEKDARSTLITFEPHPQLVLGKKKHGTELRLLTSIEEKISALSETRLHRLIIANFTRDFSVIEPEDFIRKYLLEKCKMSHIVIGHDHAFGRNRKGNINLLHRLQEKANFNLSTLDAITLDGEIVSSTRIRGLLSAGDVARAAHFLGRPYSITGQVIQGDGRGKNLGFPTANLRPYSQHKLVPKFGIYATHFYADNSRYDSVTYIGNRSTFHLSDPVIEVHVLDKQMDLYNKEIRLDFHEYIREDETFPSAESLVEQIRKDIEKTRKILAKNSSTLKRRQ